MKDLFELGKVFLCIGLLSGIIWAACNFPLWQFALAGIGIGAGCMVSAFCIVGIKIIWKMWRETKRHER